MSKHSIRDDIAEILTDHSSFEAHRAANLSPEVVEEFRRKITESGIKFIYYMVPTLGGRMGLPRFS